MSVTSIGVVELVIIVCGGGLTLLATIAVGYLFIQNRKE